MNYFSVLNAIDVSEHTQKKGNFTYLSWPYAVGELLERHPATTWEVHEYDGKPYMQTPAGFFVKTSVTVDGVTRTQVHPVLDNYNKPIQSPNAFQINTSIQRCLVKAIALHGLGLYIYAGEDLPRDKPEEIKNVGEVLRDNDAIATALQNLINQVDAITSRTELAEYQERHSNKVDGQSGKLLYLEKNDKEAYQEAMDYIKQKAEIL